MMEGEPTERKGWGGQAVFEQALVEQTHAGTQWEEVGAEDTGWNSFEQLGGWKEGKLQSAANGLSHSAGST
ncbi:hypothetical protein VDGL01_07356 [Verticillium dahliae]